MIGYMENTADNEYKGGLLKEIYNPLFQHFQAIRRFKEKYKLRLLPEEYQAIDETYSNLSRALYGNADINKAIIKQDLPSQL